MPLIFKINNSQLTKHFKIKLCIAFLCSNVFCFSQEEAVSSAKESVFREDSSFANFGKYHETVAKAQIIALKNGGALLVRLKTNINVINRLKEAGNIDLATHVEREAQLNNVAIIRAFTKSFTFCPVYFFYSDCSDSVKHKNIEGIFIDSNLTVNPTIVCRANFYLVAEQGSICESSLGLVPEVAAAKVIERGTPRKEVFMIIKNRYFIQLHKPFPYFQQGYSIKKYADYVKKLNIKLFDFYNKNKSFVIPIEVKSYVY